MNTIWIASRDNHVSTYSGRCIDTDIIGAFSRLSLGVKHIREGFNVEDYELLITDTVTPMVSFFKYDENDTVVDAFHLELHDINKNAWDRYCYE